VRGEQDGAAGLAPVALEPGAHPVAGVGVEGGGRLVQQEEVGAVDQRLGQRHPRLLPGRERAGGAVQQLGQLEVARQGGDARGQLRDAVEVAIDAQVLFHAEPVRQGDVGRGEIHPGERGEAVPRHVVPQRRDAPRGGHQQAEQHADRGGLARAIAAEQAERGSLGRVKLSPSTAGGRSGA
jgi:ATP-binding cassette subfamily B protein